MTVVVGAQGEVREFRFHDGSYRDLPPAELSALLVELVNAARREMAATVAREMGPLAGFGDALRESMTGGTELERMFAPVRDSARRGPSTMDDDEEE